LHTRKWLLQITLALVVISTVAGTQPSTVEAQSADLPKGQSISQSIVEIDVNSAGSASVKLTLFLANNCSDAMNSFNMTFPQSIFDLLAKDLISGRGLNYRLVGLSPSEFTAEILLDPSVPPYSMTIVQLSFVQVHLAVLTSELQGLWTLRLTFGATHNLRFFVKLPPAMDRTSVQLSPQQEGPFVEGYLDSDNRWVIVLAAAQFPADSALTIQYRLSTKLWGYFFVAAITFFFSSLGLMSIRLSGAKAAFDKKDREGAYALWQMSLAIHLALLAVVGGAWGLLITQEPMFPSLIDEILGFLLALVAIVFVVDTFSFASFTKTLP